MYAIIYWVSDDEVFPVVNEDRSLRLWDKSSEAHKFKRRYADDFMSEARVISIEGVKE